MRRKPVFKKICLLLAAVMLMSMMPVDLFALAVEDMGEQVVDEVLVREEAPSEGANVTTQPEATTLAPESPGEEIIPPADPEGAAQGEDKANEPGTSEPDAPQGEPDSEEEEEASEPAAEGEDAKGQTPGPLEEQPQIEQGEIDEDEASAKTGDWQEDADVIVFGAGPLSADGGIVPLEAGEYGEVLDQTFEYRQGTIPIQATYKKSCSIALYLAGEFVTSATVTGGSAAFPTTATMERFNCPDVGTYTITVNTRNHFDTTNVYEVFTATLTITKATLTDMDITFPTASDITYGQTLGDSTLTGGSTDLGTFAFNDPYYQPSVGLDTPIIVFTPNADALKNYDFSLLSGWDSAMRTITRTVQLQVNKAANNLIVTCDNVTYGQELNPQVTNPNGGAVTLEYKAQSAGDGEYTEAVPTDAGLYTVRATSAATGNYEETKATADFEIHKADNNLEIFCWNTIFGTLPDPEVKRNDSGGAVTMEYKGRYMDDSAYSPTPPTALGSYTVRGTSAATTNYKEATATWNFTIINKSPNTLVVSCDDITYGEPQSGPWIIQNVSGGYTSAEYKVRDEDDVTYAPGFPTNAGLYTVRITSAETYFYLGATATADFEIHKAANNLSVSCGDITYGQEPNPQVINPNGGAETIEYKAQGADDSAYTAAKPINAGAYTVRVTSAATVNYTAATATADFEIGKAANNLSISCGDITYGQEPNPQVTNPNGGAETTEYKAQDAGDGEYTAAKPINAGAYTVRVISAATDNYEEAKAAANFEIYKAPNNLSVTCGNVTYGQEPNPQVINPNGGAEAIEYKTQDAGDGEYTAAKPINAGAYTVRVTSAATVNYEEATATNDFEICKAANNLSVTCSNVTYGQEPNPQVTNPNGGAETIAYKVQGAPDSAYTAVKPINAGAYTVRVTSAATLNYEKATATDDFTISPATPSITPPIVANAVGKGTFLSQIALRSGKATGLGGQEIAGRFDWKSPQTAVNASGNYAVMFVPDSENYSTVECSVAVEVDTVGPTILSLSATPVGSNEAVLEVVAMDDAMPLTYQWQVKGSWIDIPGATSARFDYQGLNANQEYTVRVLVTDAHGNTTVSPEIAFKTGAAVIANLPGSYTLIVGQSVSFTPAPSGGEWSYDETYLSLRQDGDKATFKALKIGKTSVTYTVGGTQHMVMITINERAIPQTGDDDSAIPYAALCMALLLVAGTWIIWKRRRHA